MYEYEYVLVLCGFFISHIIYESILSHYRVLDDYVLVPVPVTFMPRCCGMFYICTSTRTTIVYTIVLDYYRARKFPTSEFGLVKVTVSYSSTLD